ncbi:MAG: VTT domain-containing protein [Gemmataceae bacterium]|nr:VTT domain-containing protein [Gemmataceae bacterium]
MDELFTQVADLLRQVVTNLTNPDAWKAALSDPRVTLAAFIAVNLIVFTETGLLVGFFLPGDSLLVTAGVAGYIAGWPIHWLILTLWGAAILGDSSGYLIGRTFGPRLFRKEKPLLFRKDYLLAAQDFYDRHGGKTIVLAKFVPFLRTFAPVVAGAGRMPYRRFLAYSVGGAVGWITSMVLLGYTLHLWLDPFLTWLFGRPIQVAKEIDKVIIVVIAISVLPIAIKGGKGYLARRRSARVGAGGPPASTP